MESALLSSSILGHTDVVKSMLDKDVDINAGNEVSLQVLFFGRFNVVAGVSCSAHGSKRVRVSLRMAKAQMLYYAWCNPRCIRRVIRH